MAKDGSVGGREVQVLCLLTCGQEAEVMGVSVILHVLARNRPHCEVWIYVLVLFVRRAQADVTWWSFSVGADR